jgi:protein-arginine kinase activator protein McsA
MKVCDKCQLLPAVQHFVFDENGSTRVLDLCQKCAESSTLTSALSLRAESSRCVYCGGGPCARGTDFLALSMGLQEKQSMCMKCMMEFLKYAQNELQLIKPGLSPAEYVKAIQSLREKVDRHMIDWIKNGRKGVS